jgi:hypothetical protein
MGFSILLAACFTDAPETYHHWHVFAGDSGGCCIRFNRAALLRRLDTNRKIRYGEVSYRTLAQMRHTVPAVEELPFIKRSGYADESEFRVIYEGVQGRAVARDIPISIDLIEQISFNPWINKTLFSATSSMLESIEGCEALEGRIVRSTLTGNTEWKEIVEDVA